MANKTEYVVLRNVATEHNPNDWRTVGVYTGANPLGQAGKELIAAGEKTFILVAAPLRSWHPEEFAVETTTRLVSKQKA